MASRDEPLVRSAGAPRQAAAPLVRPTAGLVTPRRLLAGTLLVLAVFPVYRLLGPDTGLAGLATRSMADAAMSFASTGLIILIGLALLAGILSARLPASGTISGLLSSVCDAMRRPRAPTFAAAAALLALLLAAAFQTFVLAGQPVLVDAMTSLLHARYLAGGQLAGHGVDAGAFLHLQQSLYTEHGWASQYPPGHLVLLAAGFLVGAPGLVGPVMLGLAVFFTGLAAERMMPDRVLAVRTGTLLAAVSTFAVGQAGAFMSHAPAAALAAIAFYAVSREMTGGEGRGGGAAILAGAAIGALFATRPLTGLALGAVVVLARPVAVGRLVRIAAGAAPFVLGVMAWNATLFGSPFTFGYSAALGPEAGLGFGTDPWGNRYGLVEAIAYTSAELTDLGVRLFEAPLPFVAVIAAWLLLAPRLATGEKLFLAWALAPVAAGLLYWHHGLFMGPRMLADSAPAWAMLASLAMFGLVERTPARMRGFAGSARRTLAVIFGTGLAAGLVWFSPGRLAGYAMPPSPALAAAAPAETPALVFVHGGWTSRIAMRLAAAGMTLDSVETALRQNPTCHVQELLDGTRTRAHLDFLPRAADLPPQVEVSPGNRIRAVPDQPLSPRCQQEIASDLNGTVEVATLYWRSDLPGLAGEGVMFVRDLGPAENASFIARYPERRPYVMLTRDPEAAPELVEYEAGIEMLWARATPTAARAQPAARASVQ